LYHTTCYPCFARYKRTFESPESVRHFIAAAEKEDCQDEDDEEEQPGGALTSIDEEVDEVGALPISHVVDSAFVRADKVKKRREFIKKLTLAQCVIYLAIAPKSNAAYKAFKAAKAYVKQDGTRPVPMHLRNAPTKLMKDLDYGKGYRYAHDEEDGFAAGEHYLPEGMEEPGFYRPVRRGLEIKIAEKMRALREKNTQARKP
jgi:hypothetical protein